VQLTTLNQRMACSVWQANRGVMDTPHWCGLPEEAREPEEADLPQRFGIMPDANAKHPGPSAANLLSFPLTGYEIGCSAMPHRSPDILPFRVPRARKAVAIFSLAGGVGSTSVAAGLARVLANCGERVMLADAGGRSLLPHFFGGKGSRQGIVRRFLPPAGSRNEVISMLSLDVQPFAGNDEEQERILEEFEGEARRADRVVWDLGNAPEDWIGRVLQQDLRIVIPLLPNAKCLLQLTETDSMLRRKLKRAGRWQFVLNQFDERDPAHVAIRMRFREKLGAHLLPFVLRNTPLVDEALLKGRTIVDHAPACPLVLDLWRLARAVGALARSCPTFLPETWGEN
jgi:cellulose biosynthesis protein BcsQ